MTTARHPVMALPVMATTAQPIPTQVGDVLVLWTSQTFTVYAVGQAAKNAPQDSATQRNVRYVNDRVTAVRRAAASRGSS